MNADSTLTAVTLMLTAGTPWALTIALVKKDIVAADTTAIQFQDHAEAWPVIVVLDVTEGDASVTVVLKEMVADAMI